MINWQPFHSKQLARASIAGTVLAGSLFLAHHVSKRQRRRTAAHLSSDVSISRNELGIPCIIAASRNDALFGLGYAIAADRLWQMDMLRRAATGRLSEITGPAALSSDRMMRLLGMPRIATRLAAEMDEDTHTAVASFAAGVNHWIETERLPIEFRTTWHRPEPWTVADSIAIFRLLAWSLSGWYRIDLAAERVRSALVDEWTDAIYTGSYAASPPIVREPQPIEPKSPEPARRLPVFPSWGASNAWAVSGQRSVTGAPLLASDPHLELGIPSLWYEASIDAPGFRVSGMTIPGFPGIGVGRTPELAWGLTAGMISQTFLYREELSADDTQYAQGDEWQPLQLHDEVIGVRDRQPEILRVRSTPRGPLISDLEPELAGRPVSLHWTGMESSCEMKPLLLANAASSIEELVANREPFGVPSFNLVAADSGGNIGMVGLGKTAIREPRAGLLDPDQFPPEYVPAGDLPLEINPERGWVACANNRTVGDDYPYPIYGIWAPAYRCRRIITDLEARSRHSTADMRALQLDQYSIRAAELTPPLIDAIDGQAPEWAVQDLKDWDYQMLPESRAALLFNVFHLTWTRNALGHHVSESLLDLIVSSSRTPAIPGLFVDRLLKGELPAWFDGRTRQAIAARSFEEALQWIQERLGPDHSSWSWGDVNRITFSHPLARIPGPHRQRLSIGPLPAAGDRTTVNPSVWFHDRPFEIVAGPSMRFVTDLRRPGWSWATNTLGQSGSPLSRHYRDQLEDYREGDMHRLWLGGDRPRSRTILRAQPEAGPS